MRHLHTFYRWLAAGFACFLLAFCFGGAAVYAASSTTTKSQPAKSDTAKSDSTKSDSINQSVSQAYGTDSPLQRGMIVKLKEGDAHTVVPLDNKHPEDMYGIVIAPSDSVITISGAKADPHVAYVASYGEAEVLVSNENGAIKAGDFVAISAVDGIGMAAGDTNPIALGKAKEGFNGTSNVISKMTVKRADGTKHDIAIGRISVTINVGRNPLLKQSKSAMMDFFQQISSDVADKPVGPSRVYMSLAILLVSTVVSGSLLYSGVRSSMISIGRNPLAKKSILRSMIQVVITSLTVFIIGVFGVYLLIRL